MSGNYVMNKTYLYLDDERMPKTTFPWIIVRSYDDAVAFVEKNGTPDYISFDHDIASEPMTGYDFAKWIVEQDLNGTHLMPVDFGYNIHSANPVGRDNIMGYLNNYLSYKRAVINETFINSRHR